MEMIAPAIALVMAPTTGGPTSTAIRRIGDHTERTCAAYRRSSLLVKRINAVLSIIRNVLVSSVLVALFPSVPTFTAAMAVPAMVIDIIQTATGLAQKREKYDLHYNQYRQLLTFIKGGISALPADDDTTTVDAAHPSHDLVKEVFDRTAEIEKLNGYIPPMERYIAMYELNGYSHVELV